MPYDFNTIIDRHGSNSVKWETDRNVIPMWIADMDFRVPEAVINAFQKRAAHGIFGYARVPEAFYDSLTGWFERRHDWKIRRDSILYTTGVVAAVSAVIKAIAKPGEGVIVLTPVYNCFFSSIRNMGCTAVCSPLLENNGVYSIDFDDLEKKASEPNNKILLFCSPHNPAGRVWTAEELKRVGEICFKNGIRIIADEIHCDLVFKPHRYIPFAKVHEQNASQIVTCLAPSKTFNLAGLHVANIVADDPELRKKIDKVLNIHEVCDLNAFAIEAQIAAYNGGDGWLNALLDYLQENYQYVVTFFAKHIPAVKVIPLEGTYLVWLDCRALKRQSADITRQLKKEARVWLNEGTLYGDAGEGFIRLNIACPRSILHEALTRIQTPLSS